MDIANLVNYIRPELIVLVIFVYCIGLFLKQAPAFTREWKIPFILLVISIVVTILYLWLIVEKVLSSDIVLMGIIQGVLIASVAVFGNEILKQLLVKRNIDNGEEAYLLKQDVLNDVNETLDKITNTVEAYREQEGD